MKKFDFKDITIVPEVVTTVESRNIINLYNEDGYLPLMVSPMDTVIDEDNYMSFLNLDYEVCIPRGSYVNSNVFISISLDEFETLLSYGDIFNENEPPQKILVDIANGHMTKLHSLCEKFVSLNQNGKHKLMVGNIANPKTYKALAKIGVDYVRVGIGCGCFINSTKVNTINGFKNIDEINIGDMVLTHTGSYKKVLKTIKKEWSDDLIKINDEIVCTADHKFYVLNKNYLNEVNDYNIHNFCEWVSAEELKENSDYLLVQEVSNNHDN